jgi:DNA-binding CsgD family transcriptional regulator
LAIAAALGDAAMVAAAQSALINADFIMMEPSLRQLCPLPVARPRRCIVKRSPRRAVSASPAGVKLAAFDADDELIRCPVPPFVVSSAEPLRNGRAVSEIDRVIEAIADAPLARDGWVSALQASAKLLGGWGGQFLAHSKGQLAFSITANVPDDVMHEFVPSGAADPGQSPRIAAVTNSPLMRVITDSDYLEYTARRRYPVYKNFYDRADAHYCASGRISNTLGMDVNVALFHSRGGGEFTAEQLRLLEAMLPHFRAAYHLTQVVEAHAARLALGAFENFAMTAIVCDGSGRLLASSSAGEDLLRRGELLSLRRGMVRAVNRETSQDLARVLSLAAAPVRLSVPPNATILLRSADGVASATARIARFPREGQIGQSGPVLIAISQNVTSPEPWLRSLGLSAAEADVADAAASGLEIWQIARRRGVSRETVRSQLKAVYSKLGVSGAVKLSAYLSRLR